MLYGFALSGTGTQIERSRLENLSNNLANADTPGFKQDLLTVMQRPPESQTILVPEQVERLAWQHELLDGIGGGVWLDQTHTAHAVGGLQHTSNNLDFALTGRGFFVTEEALSGMKFYTRAGNFKMNNEGMLVTTDGQHSVLNDKGQKINLGRLLRDNGAVSFNVNQEGAIEAVTAGGVSIDTGERLGLAVFSEDDTRKLDKHGHNMFVAAKEGLAERGKQLEALTPAERRGAAEIRQGYLETSGANPVELMAEMISINRAYEQNISMLRLQNGTLERLISGVGNV